MVPPGGRITDAPSGGSGLGTGTSFDRAAGVVTGGLRDGGRAVVLKVLVYGAGVIGSLFAARLADSGQDVSILARGDRLTAIRDGGIELEEVRSGLRTRTIVDVVERLSPEDSYDLVVVCVGKHQLPSVLPALEENRRVANVLFMLNNAEGSEALMRLLGRERVVGGFPGAGGVLDGGTVKYLLIRQQRTVLGEPDGRRKSGPRLREMVAAFRRAGFPTETTSEIDAWLKTHATFISCVESAVHLAGDDNRKLARSPDALLEMVDGVREGFEALGALKTPVIPLKLRIMFAWMPRSYPVGYWRRELQGELGDYSLAPHTRASIEEVRELIAEVRALVRSASVPAPAMDRLFGWADAASR
ncbi:MAG: 2-dehydropantoate 2-reductase N-terminal domain-containing protein [Nitrososphaerales archaeon]